MDPFGNLTRCNTVTAGYGNLLSGQYRLDDLPSPCPVQSCGCPYQGFKYAGNGAFGGTGLTTPADGARMA